MTTRNRNDKDDMIKRAKPRNPPAMNPPYDGTASHQQDFNAHIEGRVGRIEGSIENLTNQVQENTRNTKDLISAFGSFKDNITTHIGAATAPKWPLITSFVLIALTVVGLMGTLVTQNISGQGQAIVKLGVRADTADIEAKAQAFKDGEHKAWRETTESRLSATQMGNEGRDAALQTQISELNKWKLDHESTNAKEHGKIDAEMERLKTIALRMEERQYDIARLVAQLDYLRPGSGIVLQVPKPAGPTK